MGPEKPISWVQHLVSLNFFGGEHQGLDTVFDISLRGMPGFFSLRVPHPIF